MKTSILGQPSVAVRSDLVEAFVSELGGHLGPVTFRLGDRLVQPLSVAPWAEEPDHDELPPILKVLRGDFFCLPFGGNATPYQGEKHPIHGDTANGLWQTVDQGAGRLRMQLATTTRPGVVEKEVSVRAGETAVYQRHVVSGMEGPMSFGMHLMLKFRSEGLLATSSIARGQVYHGAFERPEQGGYNSLRSGAMFESLDQVPLATGGVADLSRYPSRDGFEDLVQVFANPADPFAWWTVTFPDEGYVFYQLKNAHVLTGTVLWHSNGGRHYRPWSGRHRGVLGLEEVTSYFHDGLAESVAPNPASEAGFRTHFELNRSRPLDVRVVFGVAALPPGMGRVVSVTRTDLGIVLSDGRQTVEVPVDHKFLALGSS